MITKVTHLPIFVNNQDEALAFYTEKLGFDLNTDSQWDTMRWLTVSPKQQPYFELILTLADTPEQKALVGKQGGGMPLIAVEVDNCEKAYAELVEKGVTSAAQPETKPWGISAMVKDLYGNDIYLVQSTK